jgi:electron transfer flavoprotein beta subunit
MNIVVCVKQVPDTEARIKVKEGATGIVREGVKFVISPYDEFALEEALRLKEKHGGSVTTLAIGPDRAKEALRTTLAVGADKAIHIQEAALAGLDGLGIAKVLSKAVGKMGEVDLVLVGKKAVGVDRGQVGAQLAQMLDWPFVAQVSSLETDGGTARVEREIEGGGEVLDVDLPAVLSAEKTAHELRKPSLKGIMGAKSKPIGAYTLGELGLSADDLAPRVKAREMAYPAAREAGRIIEGAAVDAARELVRVLHEEAKVI